MSAESEITKLALFFDQELPEDIDEGTPVDNAIRIIRRELELEEEVENER